MTQTGGSSKRRSRAEYACKLLLDPSGGPLLGSRCFCGVGAILAPEIPTESGIRDWCVSYLARTLDLADQPIDPDTKFARLGLDSASGVYLIVELEEWLGLELSPEVIFEYPTIAELARYLAARCAGGN